MHFDWQQYQAREHSDRPVVDPRRRLWICLVGFVAALLVVFGRAVQLEVTQGAGFRAEALRPIEKRTVLPAARGRILARHGEVLACDETVQCLAVEYRWLQEPPDEQWLRVRARSRLAKAARRNAEKLAGAKADVLAEQAAVGRRLATLCGLSAEQWNASTRRIQDRVTRIAQSANRRRQSQVSDQDEAAATWAVWFRRLLLEAPPPARIIVAEELTHHVVVEDVPDAVAAAVSAHADQYPGAKIVEVTRRTYVGGAAKGTVPFLPTQKLGQSPTRTLGQSPLAAHVLGHMGAPDEPAYAPGDLVGRMGVERQYEAALHGRPGVAVERTDRSGRTMASYHLEEPQPSRDVVLTLDAALQRTAEELLRSAGQRRAFTATEKGAGGAIAVMDVRDGSLRAAASSPTFDPTLFVRGTDAEIGAVLADETHPLFDRVCQMAIPPGPTLKVVTAAALLDSAVAGPEESFVCQGYLHDRDRQRCEIYVRQGVGHGDVNLADALCVSCNVYFFEFAGRMGPGPLVDWARRFGLGRPTGVDLPGEVAGTLPSPETLRQVESRDWRSDDTQSLAIGQGSLTATPLQMLSMMAAVANGGRLVRPHVVERVKDSEDRGAGRQLGGEPPNPCFAADRVRGLERETVEAIREGLRRVVADPEGTAHATVYLDSIAIAGKTGTAETGDDRGSHAWFVGYVPADDPKFALVVVLEHAGEAGSAAGPLVKRLVLRMEQLGML